MTKINKKHIYISIFMFLPVLNYDTKRVKSNPNNVFMATLPETLSLIKILYTVWVRMLILGLIPYKKNVNH